MGRHILRYRTAFAASVLKHLESFNQAAKAAGSRDSRGAFVYGVGYAGFMAANDLFEGWPITETRRFRDWLIRHCRKAAADVSTQVHINSVWADIISGVREKAIDINCFRCESIEADHPPDQPNQIEKGFGRKWQSCYLFIDFKQMYAELESYLRSKGRSIPLNIGDLRDQMRMQPYWLTDKEAAKLGRKFSLDRRYGVERGAAQRSWGIIVDKHPLGLHPISDEQFAAEEQSRIAGDESVDIRRGELFEIVSLCEKAAK